MTQSTPIPADQIQATASQLATAVSQQQMILSEKVGALKAFEFTKKLLTVSSIKMLAEIKETNQYKGLQLIDQDGKLLTVSTWEQFCEGIGRSRQHLDRDILNLSVLGEDFLETSQRMGVGYRQLRSLRKLSEEDRQLIINGEAVQAEDKDSLIDLIEEMSVKHAKDKDELTTQVKELTDQNNAKDKVMASKDKKINNLDGMLSIRKDPANAHILAGQLEKHLSDEMQQASSAILTAISQFNTAMITLKEQANEDASHLLPKLEGDISYVYNRIAELAVAEGIDIDLAELVTPSWMADFNSPPAKGELEGVNEDFEGFELTGQTPEEVEAQQD